MDPGFGGTGLCLAAGNALIDSGVDVQADLYDNSELTFQGNGPEVGAREHNTARTFGATTSVCPRP